MQKSSGGGVEAEDAVYAAMLTKNGETVSHNFPCPYDLSEAKAEWGIQTPKTAGEYTELDGEKVMIASVRSDEPEFYYLVIAPSNIILHDLYSLRNYFGLLTAAGILLGVAVFAYAKVHNYNPIRQLFLMLKSKGADMEDGDEIRLIEKTVRRITQESEEMKNAVSQQYPVMRNNLLVGLMAGTQDAGEVCGRLEDLDIVFAEPNFLSLLLKIEIDEIEDAQNQKERLLIYAAATNISQDLFRSVGAVYFGESPDGIIYLLVNTGIVPLEAEELIYKTASELISLMNHLFHIQMTIGMSTCRQGIQQIPRTGQEAAKALKNRMIQGSNTVCMYQSKPVGFGSYYYPLELEQKLVNCVMAGDQEQAGQILENIYNFNFQSGKGTTPFANCLMFDILGTIMKLMGDMEIEPAQIFPNGYQVEKEMLKCSSVKDMFDVLRQVADGVCAVTNANKKSSSQLMDKIQSFIDENYCKDSICITLIADAVEITPTYLSHFFKENTGISVMRYIEQRRMDKVKQLLADTSLMVNEIAAQTGFTNSAVLIRTFKKNNGITPGQYRQAMKNGEQK